MLRTEYKVIGVMSGTSLDGVDLAYCTLREEERAWSFDLVSVKTISYNATWKQRLKNADLLNAEDLVQLDIQYGTYIGKVIQAFIQENIIEVDYIASHGHTVFHQPENGFTCQIGHGESIFKETNIPLIHNFRVRDVALGGQGAPLVPIGDSLLFNEYDYCLNLGGIANISYDENASRVAFDICPANMLLNQLTEKIGKDYDQNGELGASGTINLELLSALNNLAYYKLNAPKSMGKEWLKLIFWPLINSYEISIQDALRTAYEHIAEQIMNVLKGRSGKMLVSGGGAHNDFLMQRINAKTQIKVIKPTAEIIDYKEALVFALLGVLKVRNEINTLSSVTGAISDSSGGIFIT